MAKVEVDVEALAERLSNARCIREKDICGHYFTDWVHLRPIDLELAVTILSSLEVGDE